MVLTSLVMGGLWLVWPSHAASWKLSVRADDVDDRLQVQVKPCSAPIPGARYIALNPKRPDVLADDTVPVGEAVVFAGVTSKTVVTLQLYNDVGSGGVNGHAEADGQRVFNFRSPEVPYGETQRVWGTSYYGDGRPAPLPASCRKGLPTSVVQASRPSVRPTGRRFQPPSERRHSLALGSLLLLAFPVGLGASKSRNASRPGDDDIYADRGPATALALGASLLTTAAGALNAPAIVWLVLLLASAALIGYAAQPHLRASRRARPASRQEPIR
jgi:hypothetical protein